MKKGLSILLVAAALFGFYGSAVNLNDILACKDYWEEAGEKSTADMNKLEDGLNQLKENEQAYLDGKDQVAEGEKTLADAEVQLAEGKNTLAKGEADYAAAPAKLADARKQLADGEAKLADGEESLNGLTKLIAGIRKLRGEEGYEKWKNGYDAAAEGRRNIQKGVADSAESLTKLSAFLQGDSAEAYLAVLNGIVNDEDKQGADDYKAFIGNTNALEKTLPEIQEAVKTAAAGAKNILGALEGAKASGLKFAGTVNNQEENLLNFAAFITDESSKAQYETAVKTVSGAFSSYSAAIKENTTKAVTQKTQEYMESQDGQAAVAQYMQAGLTKEAAVEKVKEAYVKKATPQIQEEVTKQVDQKASSDLKAAIPGIINAMGQISGGLDAVNEQVNGKDSAINNALLPGLKLFNGQVTTDAVNALTDGQNSVAQGVSTVASAVLDNETLKAGVKKNFGNDAITLLNVYKNPDGLLSTSMSNFAVFEAQMDKNPGIDGFLLQAQKLLTKTRADGLKTYKAGKAKLANGYKQYRQGLADYNAAPGKLADGRQQIADGEAQIADGRQQLADGKAKLAEYEDGEQQVRDGLKTLTDTEADLDLKSIADRLNGDVDFDNGDAHLDLDEGLAAVDVGRGYQAEDGVLISDEIMARAVGTGALLGAGVLAVIAAILSFLKKNKGAGVFAILAAAAGAFGAFYGTNAGTYFSDIAGSTAGSAGWVAAGILGVIALAHAIVHFTAKKEA